MLDALGRFLGVGFAFPHGGWHNRLLRDLSQLPVRILFLFKRLGQEADHLLLSKCLRKGDVGAISRNLVMLDALHASHDDRI